MRSNYSIYFKLFLLNITYKKIHNFAARAPFTLHSRLRHPHYLLGHTVSFLLVLVSRLTDFQLGLEPGRASVLKARTNHLNIAEVVSGSRDYMTGMCRNSIPAAATTIS